MSFCSGVSVATLAFVFIATPVNAQRSVAVTFDDLPGVSVQPCNAANLRAVNQKLLASLQREKIPAAVLVTPGRCAGTRILPELMDRWLDAGHTLGNHSYSHEDFNRQPLDRYIADARRGAAAIEPVLAKRGRKLRYFRHPLLHAGNSQAKLDGFNAFLQKQNWRVAVVTIDNQEWVYAERYTTALRRRDNATIARLVPAYLEHLDSSFAYYERLSNSLFKRQIPQVLLLHVNPLNADHFDKIAALMRRRGYTFVSLDQALSDPAYRSEDRYVGPRGLSWLQRWALTRGLTVGDEPREHAWVANLYR